MGAGYEVAIQQSSTAQLIIEIRRRQWLSGPIQGTQNPIEGSWRKRPLEAQLNWFCSPRLLEYYYILP